jgi:hypothetical protein
MACELPECKAEQEIKLEHKIRKANSENPHGMLVC